MKLLIFANPYPHHTFFTRLGLLKNNNYNVIAICPGLDYQDLRKMWRPQNSMPRLKLGFRKKVSILVSRILAMFLFILFKIRIISDDKYHELFSFLVLGFLVNVLEPSLLYTYHHYFNKFCGFTSKGKRVIWINEQIIEPRLEDRYYNKQISCEQDADISIAPFDRSKIGIIFSSRFYQVSYGGDTLKYMTDSILESHYKVYNKAKSQSCNVVVRANDFRKGIDIFFEGLELACSHLNRDLL
ncbi:hypothetical protein OA002_03300, partial [bacterium]|nr:hypothetical protein [bacterium]